MSKVEQLIERILSKSKFAPEAGAAGKVYRDEPILFAAARLENLTPPRYGQMRKIAEGPAGRRKSTAQIFSEQGKFMEDFEDDFDFQGKFARYFPTYQAMNTQELRGYFSWRTRLRRGRMERTHTSFAFVHIYELINQIGVASPQAGFFALRDFWLRYRELDYQIDRYVETWLRDYVVYNNLDKALLAEFSEANFDQALVTLADYRGRGAADIFSALNSLSSYNLENSRFFKQRPEEFREVVADVFARLSDHYDKNNKNTLFGKFFGRLYGHSYTMFNSAVFYEDTPRANCVYEINPVCKYVCKGGNWSCERFFGFSGGSLGLCRHDLALNLRLVHRCEFEAFGQTADLRRVLCFHHDVAQPVGGVLRVAQDAVNNAILFRALGKFAEIALLDRVDFQRLAGFEHGCEPRLALELQVLVFVFQRGEQQRDFLCGVAGDPGGDLDALQAHAHDLFSGVA